MEIESLERFLEGYLFLEGYPFLYLPQLRFQ